MRCALAVVLPLLCAGICHAEQIVLKTGDVLHGEIIATTDTHIVLQHSVLGTLRVPLESIAMPESDSAEAPSATEAPHEHTPEEATQPPLASQEQHVTQPAVPQPKENPWKSRLDLSFAGSWGNTDTQEGRFAITTKRESERYRAMLDAAYFYGASDGDRTENKFTAGGRHDWLVPDSRWFYFAQGRYDYDEFQSWEHRLSAAVGPGYELIKKKNFNLLLRAGLGVVQEFGSDDDELRPEALFGGEINWDITDSQRLSADSTIYPDLGDTGEFRVESNVRWEMDIDQADGLALHFGLRNEYESQTDTGIEHSDLKVFGGLTLDF